MMSLGKSVRRKHMCSGLTNISLPFGMRTITAYDFWQLQVPFGWGHFARGRPALGTFIMSLSKCWHFDDR